MKYKDRKHAKRKYKQALLATVATMTLGVSTLGSTASAFAEEKDTNATQQQTVQQKSAGTYYDADKDPKNFIAQLDLLGQNSNKQLGAKNYKTGVDLIKTVGPQALKLIKDGDGQALNALSKSVTSFVVGMVPYGAALLPLIDFIWPSSGPSIGQQLDQLKKELQEAIKKESENLDTSTIRAEMAGIIKTMQQLPGFEIPGSGSFYEHTLSDKAFDDANWVNNEFNRLMSIAAKLDDHKQPTTLTVAELPQYVVLANLHITFLRYMSAHGKDPAYQMSDDVVKKYTDQIPTAIKEYTTHIQQTFNLGEAQINKKLNDFKGIYADLTQGVPTGGLEMKNADYLAGNANAYKEYVALLKTKEALIENTIDSPLFKAMQLNPEWKGNAYINTEGKKITGFVYDTVRLTADPRTTRTIRRYYVDPKTGEMATGWQKIDGKSYYFEEYDTSRTQGQMVVGRRLEFKDSKPSKVWLLSPVDGFKNDEGETFKLGEWVTGYATITTDSHNGIKEHRYFDPSGAIK